MRNFLPGMEEEALSVDLLDDMEDNEDEKKKSRWP